MPYQTVPHIDQTVVFVHFREDGAVALGGGGAAPDIACGDYRAELIRFFWPLEGVYAPPGWFRRDGVGNGHIFDRATDTQYDVPAGGARIENGFVQFHDTELPDRFVESVSDFPSRTAYTTHGNGSPIAMVRNPATGEWTPRDTETGSVPQTESDFPNRIFNTDNIRTDESVRFGGALLEDWRWMLRLTNLLIENHSFRTTEIDYDELAAKIVPENVLSGLFETQRFRDIIYREVRKSIQEHTGRLRDIVTEEIRDLMANTANEAAEKVMSLLIEAGRCKDDDLAILEENTNV